MSKNTGKDKQKPKSISSFFKVVDQRTIRTQESDIGAVALATSKTDLKCNTRSNDDEESSVGAVAIATSESDLIHDYDTCSNDGLSQGLSSVVTEDKDDITPTGQNFDGSIQLQKLKNFQFPHTGEGKYNRRCFKYSWLQKFTWLEYSIRRDAAFCFICRKYGTSRNDPTFTVTGFNNWRTALSSDKGFSRHQASEGHRKCLQCHNEFLTRTETNISVSEMVNSTVLEKRRYYVKSVIKTVIFLVQNGLALRGEWDEEEHEEMGLFNKLFEYSLEKDTELVKCEKFMPKYATYKSPLIQNEIIEILTIKLRQNIVKEVMNADVNFFTILFDGTKDRHGEEIISLAARYVLGGRAMESLLSFETTEDLDAESFTCLILDSLKTYVLDAQRIISQCYDGASVMQGYKTGVVKRLQDALKKLIPYVHCFNHRLHLIIVELVKIVDAVRQFFDQVKLIYTLLKKPKIKKIYEGKSVSRLLETRWTGHSRSAKAILENYKSIVEILYLIKTDQSFKIDGDDVAVSIGVLNVIIQKPFIFVLIFVNEIFSIISPADTILQKREISYRRAIPVIAAVQNSITELRNPETCEIFLKKTDTFLEANVPIEIISETCRPVRNRVRSVRLKDFIVEEPIAEKSNSSEEENKMTFYEMIDVILSEFHSKFFENSDILTALSDATHMKFDELQPLTKIGIELPEEHELKTAKKYLDQKKIEWDKKVAEEEAKNKEEDKEARLRKRKEGQIPRFNILNEWFPLQEVFPNVYNMFAAIDTVGCSTAVCEASFSSLSRVDIPSRFSMKNKRLRNLAFLVFEGKRLDELDVNDVLKEFNNRKERRVQLF